MPGYAPSPLVGLPELARDLGVAQIVVKNEQERLGLPSYKVLGSSWALHQAIKRRLGLPPAQVLSFAALRALARRLSPATLCTATAGNHGRAVAALAEWLGFRCVVFAPAGTTAERMAAIRQHGAQVCEVVGTYDDTFAVAQRVASERGYWFCPDTAYREPADFARGVEEGYCTLFEELTGQLGRLPDVLFVQAGAGVLAAAAIRSCRQSSQTVRIISVEPVGSNCVQVSVANGKRTPVADHPTIMAGLRCQSVSITAFPTLLRGVDAAITIEDECARRAMRLLARAGIVAGESGAAGLGGLLEVAADPAARSLLALDRSATVAVINTEGATDLAAYRAIVEGAASQVT